MISPFGMKFGVRAKFILFSSTERSSGESYLSANSEHMLKIQDILDLSTYKKTSLDSTCHFLRKTNELIKVASIPEGRQSSSENSKLYPLDFMDCRKFTSYFGQIVSAIS